MTASAPLTSVKEIYCAELERRMDALTSAGVPLERAYAQATADVWRDLPALTADALAGRSHANPN